MQCWGNKRLATQLCDRRYDRHHFPNYLQYCLDNIRGLVFCTSTSSSSSIFAFMRLLMMVRHQVIKYRHGIHPSLSFSFNVTLRQSSPCQHFLFLPQAGRINPISIVCVVWGIIYLSVPHIVIGRRRSVLVGCVQIFCPTASVPIRISRRIVRPLQSIKRVADGQCLLQ